MSNVSTFVKGQIKSIQRGVLAIAAASTSASATVAAVNTAKAELRSLGQTSAGTDVTGSRAYVVLANSTTVTATKSGNTTTAAVSWELVEYY